MRELKDMRIEELFQEYGATIQYAVQNLAYPLSICIIKQEILSRFTELESYYDMKKTECELNKRALEIANRDLLKCRQDNTQLKKALELMAGELYEHSKSVPMRASYVVIPPKTIEEIINEYMEKANEKPY